MLLNVGVGSVIQHVLHVLFAHTQSLSQSFSLLHESPRQCPSQVHTSWEALLVCGRDVVSVCSVTVGEVLADAIGERDNENHYGFCSYEVGRMWRVEAVIAFRSKDRVHSRPNSWCWQLRLGGCSCVCVTQ